VIVEYVLDGIRDERNINDFYFIFTFYLRGNNTIQNNTIYL